MIRTKVTAKNTKVLNYHDLCDDLLKFYAREIRIERINTGHKCTRSWKSYYRELKAHKRLYKWGLFKNHTLDCDLEEPIKWYIEAIYWILGR